MEKTAQNSHLGSLCCELGSSCSRNADSKANFDQILISIVMATLVSPSSTVFPGTNISFKPKYDNFIGGEFVAPANGAYFDNISPINGQVFTQAARSTQADIEKALDAAWAAFPRWSK